MVSFMGLRGLLRDCMHPQRILWNMLINHAQKQVEQAGSLVSQ